MVKGIDEDVVKLRYKHHRDRLLDTINRVLDERHKVKEQLIRAENRNP